MAQKPTTDETTYEELHCGVEWCGGVPTHPTGNCVQHQDREPNPAWDDL